jgi:hypothetical protein
MYQNCTKAAYFGALDLNSPDRVSCALHFGQGRCSVETVGRSSMNAVDAAEIGVFGRFEADRFRREPV